MKKFAVILCSIFMLVGVVGCAKKAETPPAVSASPAEPEVPFSTFGEVRTAMQNCSGNYFPVIKDFTVWIAGEKNDRFYQMKGTLSQAQKKQLDDIDFQTDDYEAQMLAIINDIKIEEWVDFTDMILSQEERDSYIGQTVQNLIDSGFEMNGFELWEENNAVLLSKDNLQYNCKINLPENFNMDNDFTNEYFYPLIIERIEFLSPIRYPVVE